MLKYFLFIAFFALLLAGYFSMNIPPETAYAQMLDRVYRGLALTLVGGLGSLICLHRITR